MAFSNICVLNYNHDLVSWLLWQKLNYLRNKKNENVSDEYVCISESSGKIEQQKYQAAHLNNVICSHKKLKSDISQDFIFATLCYWFTQSRVIYIVIASKFITSLL